MHVALGAAGGQRRARATALLLALSLCTAAASSPLASSGSHTRRLLRRCGRDGHLHPDAYWRMSLTCTCACRDMPRHSLPQAAQGMGTCNNTVQGR